MPMLKRPEVINGDTRCIITGCGNIYLTINDVDLKPFEVFAEIGKAGGCADAQTEAIGRLVSGWLRSGGDVKEIISQLKGIMCHHVVKDELGNIVKPSCADAVAKALEKHCNVEVPKFKEEDLK